MPSSGAPQSAVPAPPLPSESAPSESAPTSPSVPAPAPAPIQVRPPAATVAPPPPTTRPPVVLAAHYATTSSWDTGYVAQVVVTTGAAGPQYFDLRLQLPAGVTVVDYWSNSASGPRQSDGGAVTFHDGPVSAGRSVVVGFQARKDPALARPRQFEPTSCTVNGNACS
nr:cellulose binding domain-containing protein [Planosporangium thailandense]